MQIPTPKFSWEWSVFILHKCVLIFRNVMRKIQKDEKKNKPKLN